MSESTGLLEGGRGDREAGRKTERKGGGEREREGGRGGKERRGRDVKHVMSSTARKKGRTGYKGMALPGLKEEKASRMGLKWPLCVSPGSS